MNHIRILLQNFNFCTFFLNFSLALSILLPALYKKYEHYVGFEKRNKFWPLEGWPHGRKYTCTWFSWLFFYRWYITERNRLGQTKKFNEIWEEKISTIKFEQFIWFVYGLVFSFVFVISIFHDNWHVDFGASYTTRQCGQKKDREQSLWNSNNAPRMIKNISHSRS